MPSIDKEEEKKREKNVLFWPTVSGRVGRGLLWGYIFYENTALKGWRAEKKRILRHDCGGERGGAGERGGGAASRGMMAAAG